MCPDRLSSIETFVASYVKTLHIIPEHMQCEVSAYLQSDTHYQRLQRLSEHTTRVLTQSNCLIAERKRLLQKLVAYLSAMQDICDQNMPILVEINRILETQTNKLSALRSKCRSETGQIDSVEVKQESVEDSTNSTTASDQTFCGSRSRRKELWHRKSVTVEDDVYGRNRLVSPTSSPLRRSSTSRDSPTVKWNNVIQNYKSRKTPCKSPSFHSINNRRRSANNQHQHKSEQLHVKHTVPPFPRYTQQHQRQYKKQQQQRVMSNAFHAERDRKLSTKFSHSDTSRRTRHLNQADRQHSSKLQRIPPQWYSVDEEEELGDPNTRSASSASGSEDDGKLTSQSRVDLRIVENMGKERITLDSWDNAEETCSSSDDDDDSNTNGVTTRSNTPISVRKEDMGVSNRRSPLNKSGAASNPSRGVCVYGSQNKHLSSSSDVLKPEELRRSKPLHAQPVHRDRQSTRSRILSHSSRMTKAFSLSIKRRGGKLSHHELKSGKSRIIHQSDDTSGAKRSLSGIGISEQRNKSGPPPSSSGQSTDASIGSPDERVYCLCKKVSYGEMIACDNHKCEVEWFHFSCVDIRVQPKGKWYCPLCRGESSKLKRPDL